MVSASIQFFVQAGTGIIQLVGQSRYKITQHWYPLNKIYFVNDTASHIYMIFNNFELVFDNFDNWLSLMLLFRKWDKTRRARHEIQTFRFIDFFFALSNSQVKGKGSILCNVYSFFKLTQGNFRVLNSIN